MTLSRRELSKMDISGINSHCHDRGAGLLTLSLGEYRDYDAPAGGRLVVGLHPWDTEGWELQRLREELSVAISDSRVVAIGEVGIDPLRGAEVARQEELLREQLTMAIEAGMPVMFHIVRRYDILMRLHKEMRPVVAWGVHGFRGNEEVARQLVKAGIYISVGMKFNAEAVKLIPGELLLLETDELPEERIAEVVETLAAVRGETPEILAALARDNRARFLANRK